MRFRVCRRCWRVKRAHQFSVQDIRRFPTCKRCWHRVAEPVYRAMARALNEGSP